MCPKQRSLRKDIEKELAVTLERAESTQCRGDACALEIERTTAFGSRIEQCCCRMQLGARRSPGERLEPVCALRSAIDDGLEERLNSPVFEQPAKSIGHADLQLLRHNKPTEMTLGAV